MRRKKQTAPLSPEEEYNQAASAAAGMLSRRPLSEKALRRKLLEKEFSEESIEYAMERMRLIGALDDQAYAETIVRSYRRKGCGKLRIRQELERRGVSRDVIQQEMELFEPDWDAMISLLDKRLRGDVSDRMQNEKAFAVLQRRGFSFSQIREAMSLYCEQLEQDVL